MTNLDKIRAMSAEEFVKNVLQRPSCSFCVYNGKTCDMGKDCIRGRIKWLNQEINPMPDIKIGDVIYSYINESRARFAVVSNKYANNMNGLTIRWREINNIWKIERMNDENGLLEVIWRADDGRAR